MEVIGVHVHVRRRGGECIVRGEDGVEVVELEGNVTHRIHGSSERSEIGRSQTVVNLLLSGDDEVIDG